MVDPAISQIIRNHISVCGSSEFKHVCDRLLIKLYPADYQTTLTTKQQEQQAHTETEKMMGIAVLKEPFFIFMLPEVKNLVS